VPTWREEREQERGGEGVIGVDMDGVEIEDEGPLLNFVFEEAVVEVVFFEDLLVFVLFTLLCFILPIGEEVVILESDLDCWMFPPLLLSFLDEESLLSHCLKLWEVKVKVAEEGVLEDLEEEDWGVV